MLFNSLDFAVFLPIVFLAYWKLGRSGLNVQNKFLVLSSYFFYGFWNYRFLSLIIFSTLVDYIISHRIDREEKKLIRMSLLFLSLFVNLGILGVFKYYNFFAENFVEAFSLLGYNFDLKRMHIILPVGISFYTFQTLSYTIDVYKKKIEPSKNLIAFAAYVCFFPQLVAGPIERATKLLPQFDKQRTFSYSDSVLGLQQILWGLFKKIVIADNCAVFANQIFNNSESMSGSALVVGAIFFSFQIYCDFSGYSDIAIGTAKLFGIKLMNNFQYPYFSRDIAEFWRRWHISLSTWFRDYLYIPLGGSRGSSFKKVRNVFIIFIVSGFWHGANWTFICWGALNALFFIPLLLTKRNRKYLEDPAHDTLLPSFSELSSMIMTFAIITFAWIFFRAENMAHAIDYIQGIFSKSLFTVPFFDDRRNAAIASALIMLMMSTEWMGRKHDFGLEFINKYSRKIKYLIYYTIILLIVSYSGQEQDFIYFQF